VVCLRFPFYFGFRFFALYLYGLLIYLEVVFGYWNMQINAGITTQLLLSFFSVEGVVHYGIAGNANPSLHIGDVTIPQHWAHLALWSWQVQKFSSHFHPFVKLIIRFNLLFSYRKN